MNCPCQSGKSYDECCGRFISHLTAAENAQQLMRSRYTAYTLNNKEYLLYTWHADFKPKALQLDSEIKWMKLDILSESSEIDRAMVEFKVLLLVRGAVETMHEKSQFVLQQGRWYYTTGEMLAPDKRSWKPGRNSPCPCGSGLKFKRCCGR